MNPRRILRILGLTFILSSTGIVYNETVLHHPVASGHLFNISTLCLVMGIIFWVMFGKKNENLLDTTSFMK